MLSSPDGVSQVREHTPDGPASTAFEEPGAQLGRWSDILLRIGRVEMGTVGALHHVELWVPDLVTAVSEWGWLLTELGYVPEREWERGRSWRLGETYIVIEESSALTAGDHDRCRPGLNHLAFHAGTRAHVDALTADAADHGWRLMYPDRHPFAGGPDHYASYLSSSLGFQVELVADRD